MSEESKNPPYVLWLDLESTGLDPRSCQILEVAWRLTKFEFPFETVSHPLASGNVLVAAHVPAHALVTMQWDEIHPVVKEMHEKSGLFNDLGNRNLNQVSIEQIENRLFGLSAEWPTDKDEKVVLGGNSVHFDLGFLRVHMPTFAKRLSHRVLDVSAISLLCRSLGMPRLPKVEAAHRAQADLEQSISQLHACVDWLRAGQFAAFSQRLAAVEAIQAEVAEKVSSVLERTNRAAELARRGEGR